MSAPVPEATVAGGLGVGPASFRVRALQRLLRPAERLYAIVVISIVSGAYLPLLQRATDRQGEEVNPYAHLVLLPLYAVMAWIIATHLKGFTRVALRAWPAWALVGLAIISTLWSAAPNQTFRRGIAMLAPTALGVVLTLRFTTEELVRLMAWALGLAAIFSVLVALAVPALGTVSLDYGTVWRGVYLSKNGLGRAMAFGVIVFVLLGLRGGSRSRQAWLGAGCLAIPLIFAKSMASVIVLLAVLAFIPLFRSLRFRPAVAAAVWILAILVTAILLTTLVVHLEAVFGWLGRDTTLTGRTELWAVVLATIAEEPWLGYGYNAFWLGWSGESGGILDSIDWETPHAHNGLLDLALELGVAGVVLFVLGYALAAGAALAHARQGGTVAALWPLIYLTFLFLINLGESSILKQHNLYWVLYVAVLSLGPPEQADGRAPVPAGSSLGRPGAQAGWLRGAFGPGARVSPGIRRTLGWRRRGA